MSADSNAFAAIPTGLKTTAAAAAFVENVSFNSIPAEAIRIGTRCLLDGLGLYVAGSEEHSVRILIDEAEETGGRPEALLLGRGNKKVPAPMAARVLGAAGHAHDWDDSQVSLDPAHVYGLLTHPTIPPLSAALVMAQKLGGGIDGKTFMLAFLPASKWNPKSPSGCCPSTISGECIRARRSARLARTRRRRNCWG